MFQERTAVTQAECHISPKLTLRGRCRGDSQTSARTWAEPRDTRLRRESINHSTSNTSRLLCAWRCALWRCYDVTFSSNDVTLIWCQIIQMNNLLNFLAVATYNYKCWCNSKKFSGIYTLYSVVCLLLCKFCR